ncbi:restriction endonuclease subunit S [Micromonospora sp. WMMC241]|uniref:restriction endonuclease subunit S n=1 Tax=Micromonospora sp. WMMC241 TaxID=3015159 RepID=UPI0022B62F84|nr:restriction endonuclease subunit S [Micromonospora sp. WMMC241]MCZ7440365.1 restriction endonuclease subunit S [Micromonospora sp. WMMC241]
MQLGKMLDSARNVGEPKPYLGNKAVQWGRIDLSAAGVVPMTRRDQIRFRLKANDLLVCEGGEVGRAAVWRENLPECYYQKALHRLRPKSGYDPIVMLGLLEYWASTNAFADVVTQTSIAHLPREKFIQMPLPLIPRVEQNRLREVLDGINSLVATLERLIGKKQAIYQGMRQQLLTGRTRLPGFDAAPWKTLQLLDLVSIKNGQVDPRRPEYRDLPLIAPDHVGSGTGRLLKVETAKAQGAISGKYLAAPGDIIYSKIRPYLQKAVRVNFPVLCSADMYPLTPKAKVDGGFVLHTLLSEQFTKFVTSVSARSGIPKVNRAELAEFTLTVPDLSEQQAISAALDQIDTQVLTLEKDLAKKKAVRQGMMQALLTGRTRLPVEERAA